MKKILKHFPLVSFSVLPATVLLLCGWQKPGTTDYSNRNGININQTDTTPKNNYKDGDIDMQSFDNAMKELDKNMAKLGDQMKDIHINLDTQLEALSKINFEEIEKQTEASLKQVDWNKIQNEVNVSVQNAQKAIAQIDFSKMQDDMKELQDKLQSEEFKSQFNSEKLNKDINDAMNKAKEGIDKAKQELQRMKDFTDELAADGLVDKKKGYTIQWKDGSLYINGKEQPKSISDKYRKYENKNSGVIKMEPEGAEHF